MSIVNLRKADRFELEQAIMGCWNVTDDIDLIYAAVMNRDMSEDDIANLLLGLKSLYQLKFERLFETFEGCVADRVFDPDPTPAEQE